MFYSREWVVKQIYRWGSPLIESLLDPGCQIFTTPGIDGLIGYVENRGCVVAFGDPLCPPTDRAPLIEAFHAFCEHIEKNVIYLVASEEFAKWMVEDEKSAAIHFGEELFVNPSSQPLTHTGKKGITLRGKVKHAEKSGVTIHEYLGKSSDLETQIQNVAEQWVKHRKGPQIYTSKLRLFEEQLTERGKRWFYAERGGKLVGAVAMNAFSSKQGWLLDRLMTIPKAPRGTSELMVIAIMEKLAEENSSYLSLGATNGAHLGLVSGFSHGITFLVQNLYKLAIRLFNIQGKQKFWDKFHPESRPVFLVFKVGHIGLREIKALMMALNVSIIN